MVAYSRGRGAVSTSRVVLAVDMSMRMLKKGSGDDSQGSREHVRHCASHETPRSQSQAMNVDSRSFAAMSFKILSQAARDAID